MDKEDGGRGFGELPVNAHIGKGGRHRRHVIRGYVEHSYAGCRTTYRYSQEDDATTPAEARALSYLGN